MGQDQLIDVEGYIDGPEGSSSHFLQIQQD